MRFQLVPKTEIRRHIDLLLRHGNTCWLSIDVPCSTEQKKQWESQLLCLQFWGQWSYWLLLLGACHPEQNVLSSLMCLTCKHHFIRFLGGFCCIHSGLCMWRLCCRQYLRSLIKNRFESACRSFNICDKDTAWQFTAGYSPCCQSSAIVQAQHSWNDSLLEEKKKTQTIWQLFAAVNENVQFFLRGITVSNSIGTTGNYNKECVVKCLCFYFPEEGEKCCILFTQSISLRRLKL